MKIQINDGVAIFATHFISTTIDRADRDVMRKLASCQVEADGIVVYPGQNILDVERLLKELKIPYMIETQQNNSMHTEKAKGVKYASRSEAITHFLEDKEPESQIIPNLKKKVTEKDLELQGLKGELGSLKTKLKSKGIDI